MAPAALRLFASSVILAMLLTLTSQAQQRDINSIIGLHLHHDPKLNLPIPLDSISYNTDGGELKGDIKKEQKLVDPPVGGIDSVSKSSLLGRRIMGIPEAEVVTERVDKSGIKVVKNPPDSKLAALGVRSWPRWAFVPSKFPWTYSANETSYLLEGKAKVYPEGSEEGIEIGGGDLIDFPKGMSCTWVVSVAVYKHYKFNQ